MANREAWEWIGIPDEVYNRMLFNHGLPKGRIKHRVDSMAAIQAMAASGLGVAMLPCYVADRDTRLRRVEPDRLTDINRDLLLLYHPDVRHVCIRLFADFIIELIGSDIDLFEGRRPL